MDQNIRGFNIIEQEYKSTQALPVARTFMANVFLWMTLALAVTAVTAYWFASSKELMGSLINVTNGKYTRLSMLGWIVMLAPLGFVLLMSMGFQRLSPAIMTLLFIAFSVLNVWRHGGSRVYHEDRSDKIRVDPDDGVVRGYYCHGCQYVYAQQYDGVHH
jgi:hypothetical protein